MDPKLWIVNTIVCLEYQSKKDPIPLTIFFLETNIFGLLID